MKKTLMIFGIIATLAITGCGKTDTRKDTTMESQEVSNYPAWYMNPTIEDGVAAVGEAKIGPAGQGFARKEALANARDELARQIEVKVKNMFKSYTNSVGVGGQDGVDKVATDVSKQVANQTLRGSRQFNAAIVDGQFLVLVGIDSTILKTETKKAVNSTLGNDKALWQEFKAEKAQQQLDFEIEKMVNDKSN